MMMDVPPSTVRFSNDDRKNLEQLLDVFGSVVSLHDIAAAYSEAGRDPTIAGDILVNLQPSTSRTVVSASEEKLEDYAAVKEVRDSVTMTAECVSEIFSKSADPSSSKKKKLSVSVGTVSSMIPRNYVTKKPLIKETSTREKPLKLSADDFVTPDIRDEKAPLGAATMSGTLPSSIDEFLFNMLGNGFSLDMNVIKDVVGQCGYDLNKSMDKLLDMSASTLGKSDDILNIGVEKSVECPDLASDVSQDSQGRPMLDPANCSEATNMTKMGFNLSKREKERRELQKDVLQTLFTFNSPSRDNDVNKVIHSLREVRKSSRFSRAVAKPLVETVQRQILIRTSQSDVKNGEVDEESYEVLRKAVQEYWITMKEYYKACAEAFFRGDLDKARKFLEEGQFFMTKAREADERSTQLLLHEKSENKETVTVDVHDFEPKDAVRILKIKLSSLCGIPSIQCLKILVGVTVEEAKGSRKRLILKLLERDSIAWTEEENGAVIVLRADEIDPRKLSFAKKTTVKR